MQSSAKSGGEYRPLLGLCQFLWDGLATGWRPGATYGPVFLLEMERVFERYLTNGLVAAFDRAGFYTEVQAAHIASEAQPGQEPVTIKPDVVLRRHGEAMLVVDAKWKRLRRGIAGTDDLYQALAYCTVLNADRAALSYPGKHDRTWNYRMEQTGVTVSVHSLCVTAEPEKCRNSLRRLGRTLLQSLAGRS